MPSIERVDVDTPEDLMLVLEDTMNEDKLFFLISSIMMLFDEDYQQSILDTIMKELLTLNESNTPPVCSKEDFVKKAQKLHDIAKLKGNAGTIGIQDYLTMVMTVFSAFSIWYKRPLFHARGIMLSHWVEYSKNNEVKFIPRG